jgi:hypothetical protein
MPFHPANSQTTVSQKRFHSVVNTGPLEIHFLME